MAKENLGDLGINESILRQLELSTREKGPQLLFTSLAMTNTPLSALHQTIARQWPGVRPIRTAHSGGMWEWIAAGAGESVNFNLPLIQNNLALPLLIDHTTTPSRMIKIYQNGQTQGDFLYYPGTIKTPQGVTHLPLFFFDGKQYLPFDRNNALFSPFIFARYEDKIQPVQAIHKKRNKELGFIQELTYLSDFLLNNWDKVDYITKVLLEKITSINDPVEQNKLLGVLFEKEIDITGKRHDVVLGINDRSLTFNSHEIHCSDVLAQIKALTEVVAGKKTLQALSAEFGNSYLCFGTDYLIFLAAVLGADRQKPADNGDFFAPHYHWGGLQMAGAPPNIKGYMDSEVVKKIQELMSLLKDIEVPGIGKIKSSIFILLPAAPYLLLPHIDDPDECESVQGLVNSLLEKASGKRNKRDHEVTVTTATQNWLETDHYNLSGHFANRFSSSPQNTIKHHYLNGGDGSVFDKKIPNSPSIYIPEGFDALTTRELSIVAGMLMKNGV